MIKKPNFPKIDKAYFKISIYVFFVAAALILFEKIVGNLPNISGSLGTASVYLKSLGAPFFLGFAFAYIMNPFMNFFERFLTMDFVFFRQHHKLTRMLCILTNYIIIIGGFIWILIYLLPELKASIVSLTSQLPAYTVDLNQRVQIFFDEIDFIESETVQKYINTIMDPIADASEDFPKTLETIVGNLYFFGRATVNLTFNLVMAVFIAFYMLYDKESFARQFRKIVYALSSRKAAEQFLRTMNRIHHIFQIELDCRFFHAESAFPAGIEPDYRRHEYDSLFRSVYRGNPCRCHHPPCRSYPCNMGDSVYIDFAAV